MSLFKASFETCQGRAAKSKIKFNWDAEERLPEINEEAAAELIVRLMILAEFRGWELADSVEKKIP